ncbi:DUF2178 domain-containing protein [Neiella marina]|uniref:DUF2178 domain-containing protein n=1 Tax=Neiella holothuriorum TaxID=2870530 RepID=A0ABS7EGN0_9GAMM|nr:DUF2178 domain-containing protein [Neiella holothuriorum]MBW8191493.1 DUF2178 domain-containing protein [Neiella holothuriorum]
MSFLEKSDWLMACLLSLAVAGYFSSVFQLSSESGVLVAPSMPGLIAAAVGLTVLSIIGHIVLVAINHKDANSTPDEREIKVNQQASSVSGHVLSVSVVLSLLLFLTTSNGNLLFYCVFGGFLVSELAAYIMRIYYSRTVF